MEEMGSEKIKHNQPQSQEKQMPLCLNCLRPVDPLYHYCPYCGEATGQLTPYIPFINIPWQTRIWGKMWRQIWSREISMAGKLFRLFMIIWNVPVMLIGIIPKLWHRWQKEEGNKITGSDIDESDMVD
jgi:hypothetical protein